MSAILTSGIELVEWWDFPKGVFALVMRGWLAV